uniref:Uncharacterized protein n=1 Tax=Oryza punctata TaxID=4537 RepID=A0A0E0LHT2_ORYPU
MRRGDVVIGDGVGFFIAAHSKTQPYQRLPGKHHLHLYHFATGEWETKIMDVDSPAARGLRIQLR